MWGPRSWQKVADIWAQQPMKYTEIHCCWLAGIVHSLFRAFVFPVYQTKTVPVHTVRAETGTQENCVVDYNQGLRL